MDEMISALTPQEAADKNVSLHLTDEVVSLLRSIESRLTRIETLVEVHLGKEGTLADLKDKVDGMNTRVMLLSGGVSGVLTLAKFLFLK